MKIRSDFVTNSSSSSFILAYKNNNSTISELIEKILNLIVDEDSNNDTDVGYKFNSIHDLEDFYKMEYHSTLEEILKDSWYKERAQKILDKLKDGYSVIWKDVGYQDGSLENLIDLVVKTDPEEILLLEKTE